MNDAEYLFQQTSKERKRIGYGDRHKKRQGGRNVSLPSDKLTAAQRRKLNGEEITLKLGEPITWEGFNNLPDELKKEYIAALKQKYSATDQMLGRLFLKSVATVARMRGELGIDAPKGLRPSPTQRLEWREFLAKAYQDTGEVVHFPPPEGTKNEPEAEATPAPAIRAVTGVCKISGKIICETWDDLDRVKEFLKTLPSGFTFCMEFENGDEI